MNIYNRFYRSAILGGLNYFFKSYQVTINNIFHDNGSQKYHKYFPWHVIQNIELKNENVKIIPKEIQFIDSDHRNSGQDESQLIQFIDLILGATHSYLHNPSIQKEKRKIGFEFQPTLKTLLDRVPTQNGAWRGAYYNSPYKRKSQVVFFPKTQQKGQWNTLIDSELKQSISKRDQYYYSRELQLKNPLTPTLDNWS